MVELYDDFELIIFRSQVDYEIIVLPAFNVISMRPHREALRKSEQHRKI